MGSFALNCIVVAAGTDEWLQQLDAGFPVTVALAAVALVGYLFGQRTRRGDPSIHDSERARELERASGIAQQLETIAEALRHDLASHHGRLNEFRRRLSAAQASKDDADWRQLCSEAEEMLTPTMQLAEQLSMAYDAIRQQSDALETFTHARIDPLTGVGNGRALDEKLEALIGAARRGGFELALLLVSPDRKPAGGAGDPNAELATLMAELAQLARACMRQYDFIARYGDDEFSVIMPQTKIAGAGVFGERLRQLVAKELAVTVSCGVAQSQAGDNPKSLLSRADSALYSAKAAVGNRQFCHTGTQIRERPDGETAGESAAPAAPARMAIPTLESGAVNLMAAGEMAGP